MEIQTRDNSMLCGWSAELSVREREKNEGKGKKEDKECERMPEAYVHPSGFALVLLFWNGSAVQF